jgi:LPXTG-motif cell wall-anchored protein
MTMDTTTLVLVGILAVLLFLYLGRRRGRLSRED